MTDELISVSCLWVRSLAGVDDPFARLFSVGRLRRATTMMDMIGERVAMQRRVDSGKRYVAITPCRDEIGNLPGLLRSMTTQSLLPLEWIIVDDGSSDGSSEMLDEWAACHAWIRAVHLPRRARRSGGAPVVAAFQRGFASIREPSWEYIVKLDADLTFPPSYFADCCSFLQANPAYGIVGGVIRSVVGRRLVREVTPRFHVRGATKIYRRKCWEEIGGMFRGAGWDIVDEVKANMLGWATASLPEFVVVQQRSTGAASGTWANAKKDGAAYYASGYLPAYLLLRSLYRVARRPTALPASLGVLFGFWTARRDSMMPLAERRVRLYLARQQLNRLLGRETIWK